jgi:hypothetical protein
MPMFEKPHATFSGKMAILLFIFFFCKGFSFQNFFQNTFENKNLGRRGGGGDGGG